MLGLDRVLARGPLPPLLPFFLALCLQDGLLGSEEVGESLCLSLDPSLSTSGGCHRDMSDEEGRLAGRRRPSFEDHGNVLSELDQII